MPTERSRSRFISLPEAVAEYGMGYSTLRRYISEGRLPAHRFGPKLIKLKREDLEALRRPIPTAGS